ncbi:MAG: hypothetical protein WBQ73_01510 [Candidatus Babeliales bacterium]
MLQKPSLLIILDGFGHSTKSFGNAIHQAHTPFLQYLHINRYPHSYVHASGAHVGLPNHFVGNSEVGHLTIGTGRIIEQPLTRLHRSIADQTFFTHKILTSFLGTLGSSRLHIIGLLSYAGVHSHVKHLRALLQSTQQHAIKNCFLHLFLDGRDEPPYSALTYLKKLSAWITLTHQSVTIGSLHGRFYAMDRDNNTERTNASFYTLTQPPAKTSVISWKRLLHDYYHQKITDEYIPPTLLHPAATIHHNDALICFNIREDRIHQLALLLAHHLNDKNRFLSFTDYQLPLQHPILITQPVLHNTFKEVCSHHTIPLISITETEKRIPLTYFFGGYHKKSVLHEQQIIIPSIKVSHFDTSPHMSAPAITENIVHHVKTNKAAFLYNQLCKR